MGETYLRGETYNWRDLFSSYQKKKNRKLGGERTKGRMKERNESLLLESLLLKSTKTHSSPDFWNRGRKESRGFIPS